MYFSIVVLACDRIGYEHLVVDIRHPLTRHIVIE